jgi:hypothetical protein
MIFQIFHEIFKYFCHVYIVFNYEHTSLQSFFFEFIYFKLFSIELGKEKN